MELKVVCNCGQKYKFDVEPVNGAMPFAVKCPICGADGTSAANALIPQTRTGPPPLPPALPPPLPAKAPLANRLAVSQPAAAPALTPAPVAADRPISGVRPGVIAPTAKAPGQFNLGLGIAGALAGAILGSILMYGFYELAHMRFPLIGVATGLLTGVGARLLAKGSDQTLGIIAAALALLSVVGTLFLMYGADFPVLNIISVIVSASVAYRTANR